MLVSYRRGEAVFGFADDIEGLKCNKGDYYAQYQPGEAEEIQVQSEKGQM